MSIVYLDYGVALVTQDMKGEKYFSISGDLHKTKEAFK